MIDDVTPRHGRSSLSADVSGRAPPEKLEKHDEYIDHWQVRAKMIEAGLAFHALVAGKAGVGEVHDIVALARTYHLIGSVFIDAGKSVSHVGWVKA